MTERTHIRRIKYAITFPFRLALVAVWVASIIAAKLANRTEWLVDGAIEALRSWSYR